MQQVRITFKNEDTIVTVPRGTTLLDAQVRAGLRPDAPCGGRGTCGKCKVLADGKEVLAYQTPAERDMTVELPEARHERILTGGICAAAEPDGSHRYVLAFDIGTTTVVAYLLNGQTGEVLSRASALNPQTQFGADVISRIEHVMSSGPDALSACIREALAALTAEAAQRAGIAQEEITLGAIVGNTAMHHLLLGIDPAPLVKPPYMPKVFEALVLPAEGLLPIAHGGAVRVLPNIAGFVGADTVGCLLSTRFDRLEELTLMIDIGTNGEIALGDSRRRLACSTAAGPAFEGARISCGMRGADGAVDRVWLEDGQVRWHVIGEGEAVGLCGSGLLDLVAALLENGTIDETGKMLCGASYRLGDTAVELTQKDVREVQLAKAAIRAGVELMAERLGESVEAIRRVYLAGAFGNFMNPASACRIGMIPPCLLDRIEGIGNAAGEGAKLAALSEAEFEYSKRLAKETEFLELASLPQFQDCYVDMLSFEEGME